MCIESRVFYTTISQRSCHVQHSTCSQCAVGHSFFNIQEFQTAFSTPRCTSKPLHLTLGNCIQCAFTLYRMRVDTQVFYPTISQRSCHVQHFTWSQNITKYSIRKCSICKSFKLLFKREIVVYSTVFCMGKLYSVCALTYNITAMLHSTCTENVGKYSKILGKYYMFYIKEI